MGSIIDDRGYNQGFKPGKALSIRTKRRCDWMASQMDLSHQGEILEIGCGTGELSAFLANKTDYNILATDLCAPFIEQARLNFYLPNLEFRILDFLQPGQFGENKFDYIVGNGILHHLYHSLDNTLEALRFLLKLNGKILFIEPNIYNPYCFLIFGTTRYFRKLAKLEPDEMAFSASYIAKKLRIYHFSNIQIECRDFLLPNTPSFLIKPTIAIGNFFDRMPILNYLSQSIFIAAKK